MVMVRAAQHVKRSVSRQPNQPPAQRTERMIQYPDQVQYSESMDRILNDEPCKAKANLLLSEFRNGHNDQELGRVYLISTCDYLPDFMRDAEEIEDQTERLEVYYRYILNWLQLGYRVVCTSVDIGNAAQCQVSACWGAMISTAKIAEILDDHGYESFDSPYSEVDDDYSFEKACWDRYNVNNTIEASRVFEWLGY